MSAGDERRATELELVTLGPGDIDRIMELESSAFEPSIQATADTVLYRFSLGHHMLGVEERGRLVGAIAYSFIRFSPDNIHPFPKTFKEFSTQPVPPEPNALCLYSLGVDPAARDVTCIRLLVHSAMDKGRDAGMPGGIADGPLPSYAGNAQVKPRPEVRRMIERYVETGILPSNEEFAQDPILALYQRITGCRVLALLPDFIPEDTASGGWRALLYGEL